MAENEDQMDRERNPTETAPDPNDLLSWYRDSARPFLLQHSPDHVPSLDNDERRLARLLERDASATICFLGHSGIGKSTLLNALAAGEESILPAGGVGPLTALATEVHYDKEPVFRATYHKRAHLWRLVFALEQQYLRGGTPHRSGPAVPQGQLLEDEITELTAELAGQGADEFGRPEASAYHKQASQLVAGDQFSSHAVEYLVDALRMACGYESVHGTDLEGDDAARVRRLKLALELSDQGSRYENRSSGHEFQTDLKDHAAGFLAPLIQSIEVGWPSEILASGAKLVDLPGVGIAHDAYRQVTRNYIRSKAQAVVLVVDKSGPTAEAVDLLRTSGYWERLVGAADDPQSDPCTLLVAVTKVDDVASESYRNFLEGPGRSKPRKKDLYADLVTEFRVRMRDQIADQLGVIGSSSNEAVSHARTRARDTILDSLEIHPVSAPEFRMILAGDDDDRPFLRSEEDTGVPQLSRSLRRVARDHLAIQNRQLDDVGNRLLQATLGELNRLDALWRERKRADVETKKLEKELNEELGPKRQERDLRVGGFREFLENTAQSRVRELVLEARQVAEEEVSHYLIRLRSAHWRTLRAAVSRGGAFEGALAINLPDDIASKFQEPVAAVWGQKLLTQIRARTEQFAVDQQMMVQELCIWAEQRTEVGTVKLLRLQRDRTARRSAQMKDVGKEAVADLRKVVKQRLAEAIQPQIRLACEKFVADNRHIGTGTRGRIIALFEELAKTSTKAAEAPAIRILQENFSVVRDEVRTAFDKWGDSLQETADLIVQRHEQIAKADNALREQMLEAIAVVRDSTPMSKRAGVLV